MKLLVIGVNYYPEPTGTGTNTTPLCEFLVKCGHNVDMLTTFPFYPYWKKDKKYKGKIIHFEKINGVKIIRVPMFIPNKPRKIVQRLFMEVSFAISILFLVILKINKYYDLFLYIGCHPSVAMITRLFSWIYGKPYVVKITDFAAKLAMEVGIVKNIRIDHILKFIELSAYKNAAGAIVLDNAFKEILIKSNFSNDKIIVIPNSVNLDIIKPVSAKYFRKKYNIKFSDFVIMFAGTMNIKTGLLSIIEAANILKSKAKNVKWLIVGDGEIKHKIIEKINDYRLNEWVKLIPLQPRSDLSEMLSSANMLLLCQVSKVKNTVVPGKLITYMASGRPILSITSKDSTSAKILSNSKGGIIVEPGNPQILSKRIEIILDKLDYLNELGKNNRAYAQKHFSSVKNLEAQKKFLEDMIPLQKGQIVIKHGL